MLKNVTTSLTTALRNLFGNWRTLLLFLLLYVALLVSLWSFFTLRESSILQILLTLLLTLLTPVLFFVLQTMSVSYSTGEMTTGSWLKHALRDWWKLLLISLPFLLLWWLIDWGLNKAAIEIPAAMLDAARSKASSTGRTVQEPSFRWLEVTVTTLRFLFLYLALPLIVIQLWIAASLDGLKLALKGSLRSFLKAFTPGSLLTWLFGLVVFGVPVYFLFFTKTQYGGAWMQMSLLGLRIVAALLLILFGWVLTLGVLARIAANEAQQNATSVAAT